MDATVARKGVEECEKIYQQFHLLLQVLGRGNLLFDKSLNADPASVPQKCEENNVTVAEILETMKKSLADVKQCYQICQLELSTHGSKMPSLEELAKSYSNGMEVEKSKEYLILQQELQKKNADLKFIIDEVRQIFIDINQLSTSVPLEL